MLLSQEEIQGFLQEIESHTMKRRCGKFFKASSIASYHRKRMNNWSSISKLMDSLFLCLKEIAHSGERSIWDDFTADQNGYLEAIINHCVAWKRLSSSGRHGNRSSSASVLKHRLVAPHSTSLHIFSFCQRRCCFAQQKMAPSLSQARSHLLKHVLFSNFSAPCSLSYCFTAGKIHFQNHSPLPEMHR